VNRQEAYAYRLGWQQRNLGEPLEAVTDRPLRSGDGMVVMPGKAWVLSARRGYDDAVCLCSHVEGEHDSHYGCKGQMMVGSDDHIEVLECICTGFVSKTGAARRNRHIARSEARKRLEAEEARERQRGGDAAE
jgi:hypothetical protein